jgi:hypothetical protein
VTHHGSPPPPPDDPLPPVSPQTASDAVSLGARPRRPITHCHCCGRQCASLVRQGFLRRRLISKPTYCAIIMLKNRRSAPLRPSCTSIMAWCGG